MSRTVRVKDTDRAGILTFDVNSTTFGDLKEELSSISFANKRAIVRETRVTLESSEAVLPEGSFTLYLMPEKSKAGADWTSFSFHQLRSFCSSLGLPANGVSREEMQEALALHFAPTEETDAQTSVERAISLIEEALELLRSSTTEESVFDEIERDFAAARAELGL